jgi:demethylmenaquinone methyltransferase/2-methoxy-6-polyprenyl-1,4-benzoquinol methylase
MLLEGRRKVRRAATGAPQVTADALSLPFRTAAFDAATIAFGVRNFADAVRGMEEIRRTLRKGGALGILEFSTPRRPINVFYGWYFRNLLPRLGGLITGSRRPYDYLPQSVSEFPEGSAFLALMKQAGFVRVSARRLTGGIVTIYRGENP